MYVYVHVCNFYKYFYNIYLLIPDLFKVVIFYFISKLDESPLLYCPGQSICTLSRYMPVNNKIERHCLLLLIVKKVEYYLGCLLTLGTKLIVLDQYRDMILG